MVKRLLWSNHSPYNFELRPGLPSTFFDHHLRRFDQGVAGAHLKLEGSKSWNSVDRCVNPGQEKAREVINSLPAPDRLKEKEELATAQDSELREAS